ncbi:protoheme IX farnesyltransferase, mitochondrial-like isoform X2 [Eriocheir sinensis]|uniref:protoheme IX farnesyltransferase, mitochondrial-like isoform X2 n=1 Tax=Eriocheir sinensis TaxID=95602 RepID=UPI0021C697D7|nr:protoheme IX farnesyltransferase, mitochondrial-like isoform X2 [Eriocheir sinensis]
MGSIIRGRGWSALVRACHHNTTCIYYGKSVSQCTSSTHPYTTTHLMKGVDKRFKSSAAFLRSAGTLERDSNEGSEERTLPQGDTTAQKRPVRVMVIRSATQQKPLRSNEAPLLHHARASAVVDVRKDVATHSSPQEIHLSVDQLLRDSRKLLYIAKRSQNEDEDDIEYSSERESRKHREPELVGALPPGALDWRPQVLDFRKLGVYYADLAKSRLTGLVVLTAVAGYAMAPAPMEVTTLLLCALGTGLVSAAANSINQFLEVPFDSQMDRTKNRILVRGLVTPLHAVSFASVCSIAGIGMLYFGANGLAAALGAVNLVLYTSVYTPMKRLTILNTWLGAVVGAIPPLIGWASCAGELGAGAWIMAAILYAWQFPHFNSLSWNLRPDYSRAGYRMMSVTDPDLCRRVTLRYSLAMVGICTLAPVTDVTTWTFAADSLPFNGYLVYLAWRFHQDADSKSSRKLFLFSLIHLPVIMMLMIISKKHYGKGKTTEAVGAASESVEGATKNELSHTLGT